MKSKTGVNLCTHCNLISDFPIAYCKVCKDHHHTLFMGLLDVPPHPGICRDCYLGVTPMGREWRRQQGTWAPPKFWPTSWDDPEWYDMMEEWKNTMLMEVWNLDYNIIEEL